MYKPLRIANFKNPVDLHAQNPFLQQFQLIAGLIKNDCVEHDISIYVTGNLILGFFEKMLYTQVLVCIGAVGASAPMPQGNLIVSYLLVN